jgi:hypothetical protein
MCLDFRLAGFNNNPDVSHIQEAWIPEISILAQLPCTSAQPHSHPEWIWLETACSAGPSPFDLASCCVITSATVALCVQWRREKLWRYRNRDLLWPLVRDYDMLLILPPCHTTLRVYYRELRDFMVRSVTFLLFARYYGISCVRVSSYAHDF